jgi:hypothetical protein
MSSNELQNIQKRQSEITMINIRVYFFIILGILIFTALNIFDVFTGIIIMIVMLFIIFGGQYIHYMSYKSYYLENAVNTPHTHLSEADIRKQVISDLSNNTTTDVSGATTSTSTASTASDVSGNSQTNAAGKCANGKFIWENYLEKYSLLDHGTTGETLPDDDDIKYIKLEYNPTILDWYDPVGSASTITNIREKITNDNVKNAGVNSNSYFSDGSGNNIVLLNQIQIWEQTGNGDNDQYTDDGVMNMGNTIRSLTMQKDNAERVIAPSQTSGELDNGGHLDDSFIDTKNLFDDNFNNVFIGGMRPKGTDPSTLVGVKDSIMIELYQAKNMNDLTNIVFFTPHTLKGCELVLLNQEKVELLRQPILYDYQIYKFKMGALSDERMISEFVKNTDTSIWNYFTYDLEGKIVKSRQEYAEEHKRNNTTNKYDCTTETFSNIYGKSTTYEAFKTNNISNDCM